MKLGKDKFCGDKGNKRAWAGIVRDTAKDIKDLLHSKEERGYGKRIDTGVNISMSELMAMTNTDPDLPIDNIIEALKRIDEAKDQLTKIIKVMDQIGGKFAGGKIPASYTLTDFLRDKTGKVIMPFDHWIEMIDIYLLSMKNITVSGIAAAYKFRGTLSKSNGSSDYNKKVVGEAISKVERLSDISLRGEFPFPIELLYLPHANQVQSRMEG